MSDQPTDGLLRQLIMVRPTLTDLPELAPRDGCGVRSFVDGDQAAWVAIINDSFELEFGPDGFERRMGDAAFRPERVWFATVDRQPVATASAWVTARWGETVGVLHMVGCASAHLGRGLGALVCLAALHQMVAEGRERATLSTDDFRLPAIRTYARLGFQPLPFSEDHRARWHDVIRHLDAPPAGWQPILDAPLAPLPPLV